MIYFNIIIYNSLVEDITKTKNFGNTREIITREHFSCWTDKKDLVIAVNENVGGVENETGRKFYF